ncbi:uncharacterized protein LOC131944325 [Physella acuta]|uniref:uncharacterized protein LOC131944325 n=1 Tax=Physella acuta TaxID=109671 RepID=UPI0027DE7740|nr:uncharacterized protein LOC131944325 [Physella acuta]
MLSFTKVAVLCVYLMMWSPQTSSGQLIGTGTYYSTPIYCSTDVPSYNICRPSACYLSDFRSECCMYRSKLASGATIDQCKCSSRVVCSVVATTTTAIPTTTASTSTITPTTTTSDYFTSEPQYCTGPIQTSAPKLCPTMDQCFMASTRSKCCSRIMRINQERQDGLGGFYGFSALDIECFCSGDVQC